MRYLVLMLLLVALAPAEAQPGSPSEMRVEIDNLLREYDGLGRKPFNTRWNNGAPKESYTKEKDGTWSYTRFYPTGGYAVKYQKTPSKAVSYERFFSNGKTSELLRKDERFIDWTSYWLNGQKKTKYQYNFQLKSTYYEARAQDGKQTWPRPGR